MFRLALLCTAALVVAVPFDRRGTLPDTVEYLPFATDPELTSVGTGTLRKPLNRGDASLMARILVGEAAGRPDAEVGAIAGVIFNRLSAGTYGPRLMDVLFYSRRGVFAFTCADPVRARGDNVWGRDVPRSREYRRMLRLLDDAWQKGKIHEYRSYFHPDAMTPRGRVPRWAQGKPGVRIGAALFFK